MNMLKIRSHYKVDISKAEFYERIGFLYKLKFIAGGACYLKRYDIIVGKLHIYKTIDICYLNVRRTVFERNS